MTKVYSRNLWRLMMSMLCLLASGIPLHAQTTVSIYATGTAGSYKTGSVNSAGTKNDGNMVTINSSSNRGWAVFDLSTIPTGAIVSAVNVTFTTYSSTLSSAANNIFGFTGDPATMAGTTLYNNCANGTAFTSLSWAANSTITQALNNNGIAFIAANAGNANTVLGFVRGSTNTYNIYGYPGTTAQQPKLDITYTVPAPCAGTPNPGTANGPSTVCPSTAFTLTLTGFSYPFTGLSFQWQSAPAATGPWTNITGATATTYTVGGGITTATSYRCKVTCANSSASDSSNVLNVALTPANLCNLCTSAATSTADEEILNVTLNTLNNTSTCTTLAPGPGSILNRYSNYISLGSQTTLYKTGLYPLSLTLGTCGGNYSRGAKVYIDYNQNGVFTDAGEEVYFTGIISGSTPNPTTNTGVVAIPLGASNGPTAMRVVYVETSSPTSINPCGTYTWGETEDYVVTIATPPPCSGAPTAGTINPAGPLNGCTGNTYLLMTSGTTIASGLTYQWIQSTNGGATWTPAAGTGANTPAFTTAPILDTIRYRMVVTCTNGNQRDTTAPLVINAQEIAYAAIPVTESFESWSSRCSTTDIPTQFWTNIPQTGDLSWRRNDQGSSASWTSPTVGTYAPNAAHGSYSARFHSYYAPTGSNGNLDLYVNCATVTGNKELQFYLNMVTSSFAYDTLRILVSTDAGSTFTQAGIFYTAGSGTWELKTVPIVSNSATTVIRFQAKANSNYYNDFGIDYVRVLPPCAGKPVAGTVSDALPCSGANFNLTTVGTSQVAGLTYQWQSSSASGGPWANVAGGTSPILTTSITAATYFRCIVTCTNGNQADTTPVKLINLASFYYCYCGSNATSTADDDIGNVTIRTQPANTVLLNNGTATPTTSNSSSTNVYSNFTNLPPIPMYRDSLYKGFVSQINLGSYAYGCGIAIFIDYNRNGTFDANELVLSKNTSGSSTPPSPNQVSDTFRVPSSAQIGLTGMRVVLIEGSSVPGPCGTYTWGETEDYLVDMRFPPCDGPTNAGTALISDPSTCVGYDIHLTDTTHEYERSGISWSWQSSPDGVNWSVIAGTQNRDTLTQTVVGPRQYRLRMICSNTGDTTYSNVVNVTINEPWQCYCYSIATGGLKDTTDIGAFSIGNFVVNTGGPHLLNPVAIRHRSDYTDLNGLTLWADSTYEVNFFHTMPNGIHADAKVTMFMDFNNNLVYDIPQERVLTMYTTASNWYLVNNVTIPNSVIPDVPTGLRVIINNNIGANVPSDEACGAYTSGETEDYVVTFRRAATTGVGNVGLVRDLSLYPNPTEGKFTVQFSTEQQVKDLKVVVTNLTGQQVQVQEFRNPARLFRTQMDLSAQPRGVYMVEIHADGNKTFRKLIVR